MTLPPFFMSPLTCLYERHKLCCIYYKVKVSVKVKVKIVVPSYR